MADEILVSRVRSYSSGIPGRALNQARGNHFIVDSSHDPEALSTIESFLAGVSACGVTLVDRVAREQGTPLQGIDVTIEGIRLVSNSSAFKEVNMRFELTGVAQPQAENLIQAYKDG
ncbi:MAG TPA: hypothetical protein VKU60_17665 [Chloroflexota bacterium]|nr:hypothetical protein [Chloroflexota bacterium]